MLGCIVVHGFALMLMPDCHSKSEVYHLSYENKGPCLIDVPDSAAPNKAAYGQT